jgi:hypothetical protein
MRDPFQAAAVVLACAVVLVGLARIGRPDWFRVGSSPSYVAPNNRRALEAQAEIARIMAECDAARANTERVMGRTQ